MVGDPNFASDPDCTDESILPYTKQYNIVIIATLQTEIQTFVNEDNVFKVTITPDCQADLLNLLSDWDEFPYYITATNPMIIDITPYIDQQIVTCYKECSLVQWGWNQYPEVVTFFDPLTGQINIQTSDYTWDGTKLQLKLRCYSPYSNQPEADMSDIDYFEIDMKSECRDAEITMPVLSATSVSPSLWTPEQINFTLSESSIPACGNLYYTVNGASAPLVTIDSSEQSVFIHGRDKQLVDDGPFQFTIQACHKNTYLQDINCVQSDVITVTMTDPCTSTSLNAIQLTRPLSAKKEKGDMHFIDGPYDTVDLTTALDEYDYGKCGVITCQAYETDHVTVPLYLQVNNDEPNPMQGNRKETQLWLKPKVNRDQAGVFEVFIDCEFVEYPDLGVFTSQIEVEIMEPSNCAPGEGGPAGYDSSCSDSSEWEISDDAVNGVSDDSSNDGYSGNDPNSSDSSGDGPSLGDNITSDTTGDGASDDWGRRMLRDDDGISDVEHNVDLSETRDGRPLRRNQHGAVARSQSIDNTAYPESKHGKHPARMTPDRRQLQQTAPQPILTAATESANVRACPLGQYMPKDSDQCQLCHPRTIFVDRNRPVDLSQNSVMHESCPTSFL